MAIAQRKAAIAGLRFVPRRPKAISLFSGCGGSDAGLIGAGFDIVLANDILPYARDTYLANHPETDFKLGDVAAIKSFPRADILAGCYPCQGFSQGGARKSDRVVNYLYREFDRALRAIRPKAFIVENVSGMKRADFGHLLRAQLTRYRSAGYCVTWKLLNAAEYGVAQERERILMVGLRSDLGLKYDFPRPTHGPDHGQPYRTIAEAILGLPEWPEGEFCDDPFHWYYLSRNRYRNWDQPSKTIVSHFRHMPLHPLSPPLIRLGTDNWAFAHSGPARRFSYREASRLQGFPSEFLLPDTAACSLRARYRVIGNAVPPPLFEAVARALPNVW